MTVTPGARRPGEGASLPTAYSALTHLECSRCQRGYDASKIQGT